MLLRETGRSAVPNRSGSGGNASLGGSPERPALDGLPRVSAGHASSSRASLRQGSEIRVDREATSRAGAGNSVSGGMARRQWKQVDVQAFKNIQCVT